MQELFILLKICVLETVPGVTQRVPAGLREMGCGDQSSSDSRSGGDSAVGRKRPLKKLPVKNDSLASFIHRSREGAPVMIVPLAGSPL